MKQASVLRRIAMGVALVTGVVALRSGAAAQATQQLPAAPPAEARAAAPLDLEGYWVSVVTEDWRWRMMTPPAGETPGVPLNPQGRKVAESWDLARDNSSGSQCKAFGAGGIMRIPGRIHITWEDGNTLKLEFDAGRQTRRFHFAGRAASTASGASTAHGHSVAAWQTRTNASPLIDGFENSAGGGSPAAIPGEKGSLKVLTTRLRAGYLWKNGVPYSDSATLTEYFNRHSDYGSEWFTVLSVLNDPVYLLSRYVTTTHFKREPDGSKWNPRPCETLPPVGPPSRPERLSGI